METEFDKAKATLKADMAVLSGEAVKVKAFWQDYKFYLVAFVILVVGMVAGYNFHSCPVCQ